MEDDSLLPVRMLNEVVYCPRLFWFEHVAGLFADNEHTIAGRAKHKRVDKPGGALPAPEQGDDPWESRSLWLSSAALGVTAKIDLVDVDAGAEGAVMPIDTKKGRPPSAGGLWPSDEVQVVLQAMLLRDAGYRVLKVGAYYAAARSRVVLELTEAMVARAQAAIALARLLQTEPQPPPPLDASPKCEGCSLYEICQPDEVAAMNTERAADAEPLRSVRPTREDRAPLVVTSNTVRIGVSGSELSIVDVGDPAMPEQRVGLGEVSSVSVFGRSHLTSAALAACLREGVGAAFFSSGGYLLGFAVPALSNQVHVRRAQYAHADGELGRRIAAGLVADKIANQRTLLRRNAADDECDEQTLTRLATLVERVERAPELPQLLAMEGEAAKRFWASFSLILSRTDAAFAMNGRTRRPPRDAANAMISFLAGMLVRDCTASLTLAGLDPFLGVYHTAHHGRPSLALDLMEPFRPLVIDSVVLGVVRRHEVAPNGFIRAGQEVRMDAATRRTLASAYERRMDETITHPAFGYRVSYRQVLSIHARLLARVLTGEVPDCPPFRTR